MNQVQGGHAKVSQEVKWFHLHRGEQQNVCFEVGLVFLGAGGSLEPGGLEMSGGWMWWMLEQLQPCPTKPSVPAAWG